MRGQSRLMMVVSLASLLGVGAAAQADVTLGNFSGEVYGTVFYGTKEPPYGEEIHQPFGLGQNISFQVGEQVGVNGGAQQWTDTEGLLQLEADFEVVFGDAPISGPSTCFLRLEFDLTLTDSLFQSQANFPVVIFFQQADPSLTSEPIPPGTYHFEVHPVGIGIESGEPGFTARLSWGISFPRPPPPSNTTFRWVNPNGGSYGDAANWDPNTGFPKHDATHSDTALFSLPSPSFIPVTGPGATAGRWLVSNSPVEFGGSARLPATTTANPSLAIFDGGQLRLVNGASLDSVLTDVGMSGGVDSLLEVKGGWLTTSTSTRIGRGSLDIVDGGTGSTRSLYIGAGNGPGAMRVTGPTSDYTVARNLAVGDTTAGTLDIDQGQMWFSLAAGTPTGTPRIGFNAPGTVSVHGDDSNPSLYGRFDVNNSLVVGDGASGRLNVQRGGRVNVNYDLIAGGLRAGADGQVIIDGEGGTGVVDVLRGTFVNASGPQEVVVQNGGRLSTTDLFIGHLQSQAGMADVTVRDRSGSIPTLTVGTSGGGGAGSYVGHTVPGQLSVQLGAQAELYDGLSIGVGAQGIVNIAQREVPPGTYPARLTVTGETLIGNGGPGLLQLDADGRMETFGDMWIGLGAGNPSGSVNMNSGSRMQVHGTLFVGESGIALLNIVDEPNWSPTHVFCDDLRVGGTTSSATGIVVLSFVPNVPVSAGFSHLTVYGNANVGVSLGRGEIILADPSGRLEINGSMNIGRPGGGLGAGGAVVLVDGRIEGTGNIVVHPNGSLTGTGTISVPRISAGGRIAVVSSPPPPPYASNETSTSESAALRAPTSRTLTIEGDYQQLSSGVLVLEYEGLNPGEFDVLHVTGQTTLGGKLEIHFLGDFAPEDPAEFVHSQDFIEADGGISGDYNQRVFAYPDLFADFDDDGDKDLLDVAAFQNCIGLFGPELLPACGRADWEGNGVLSWIELRELVARLTGP